MRVAWPPDEMWAEGDGLEAILPIGGKNLAFGICLGAGVVAEPIAAIRKGLVVSTKGIAVEDHTW
tara:strand:- start:27 stop:221 length:195 start_codon:yes stop_codon:yes gene_type:complete